MVRPHQNLVAWREAMRVVKMTYVVTKSFPKEELYGLTSQMRRAAVSIPSNLAEGAARATKKEFAQFVSISKGSLSELETQMLIAVDLGYLPAEHEIHSCLERLARLSRRTTQERLEITPGPYTIHHSPFTVYHLPPP